MGMEWVLLGLIGSYWFLVGFHRFNCVLFPVLLGLAGFAEFDHKFHWFTTNLPGTLWLTSGCHRVIKSCFLCFIASYGV